MLGGNFIARGNNDIRSRLGLLEDAANSNRGIRGNGGFVSRNSGGTSIFTPRSRLAPSGSSHPYKGSNASSGSTPKVVIAIGSHNSKVPTIYGVAMSAALTANLLTLDSGSKIVYVELDVVSGTISTAEINYSDSLTAPSDSVSGGTGSCYQILFFTNVAITGGSASVQVSDNVSGSQAFQLCVSTALYGLV